MQHSPDMRLVLLCNSLSVLLLNCPTDIGQSGEIVGMLGALCVYCVKERNSDWPTSPGSSVTCTRTPTWPTCLPFFTTYCCVEEDIVEVRLVGHWPSLYTADGQNSTPPRYTQPSLATNCTPESDKFLQHTILSWDLHALRHAIPLVHVCCALLSRDEL